MNFIVMALCLLGILIFAVVVFSIYVFLRYIDYLETKIKSEEQNNYKYIDVAVIDKMLQDIVDREFNEYQKFHPDLMQTASYIKQEEIKSLTAEITTNVYTNITPALRYNFAMVYDISTEEKLINLIGERVAVLVMALSATINSALTDETTISLD